MPHAECLWQLMESCLQVRMEKELAPLLAATEAVKKRLGADARVPSYGTLKEWAQARADVLVAAARGAKRGNGTLEPAQVEIDLSGAYEGPLPCKVQKVSKLHGMGKLALYSRVTPCG